MRNLTPDEMLFEVQLKQVTEQHRGYTAKRIQGDTLGWEIMTCRHFEFIPGKTGADHKRDTDSGTVETKDPQSDLFNIGGGELPKGKGPHDVTETREQVRVMGMLNSISPAAGKLVLDHAVLTLPNKDNPLHASKCRLAHVEIYGPCAAKGNDCDQEIMIDCIATVQWIKGGREVRVQVDWSDLMVRVFGRTVEMLNSELGGDQDA